jgi:hypothetical protein
MALRTARNATPAPVEEPARYPEIEKELAPEDDNR